MLLQNLKTRPWFWFNLPRMTDYDHPKSWSKYFLPFSRPIFFFFFLFLCFLAKKKKNEGFETYLKQVVFWTRNSLLLTNQHWQKRQCEKCLSMEYYQFNQLRSMLNIVKLNKCYNQERSSFWKKISLIISFNFVLEKLSLQKGTFLPKQMHILSNRDI